MSALPDCMENIIGYTRQECECVGDYEADYFISTSGLYIDELQGMSLRILDSLGDCPSILWDKMYNAKINAINCFKVDIMQELRKYKEPIRSNFTGEIGGRGFSSLVSQDTYYGLRMYSDVRGGKYILRSISLILNTTEAVDLYIYDEYDLLYTLSLQSQANRPYENIITPIELDLCGNYYFIYQPVGRPYVNKLVCNCGTYKWCFDLSNPCYRLSRDKWTEWAMIGGIKGDTISERDDWNLCKDANGLILKGNFTCNAIDTLCTDDSDFVNNEIDVAIAWAILYKTGEFLTNYIMNTGEVSRYTLLGIEALSENRVYYNRRYAVMIDFIAQNLEDERSDCLRCKQSYGISKRTHLI